MTEQSAAEQNSPQPFDLRSSTKIDRDHAHRLRTVHETLARLWANSLNSKLRSATSVRVADVEQLTYTEWVGSLAAPTFMPVVSVEPSGGAMAIAFPANVAMACFERLAGGEIHSPGAHDTKEAFSEVEESVLTDLNVELLSELTQAFAQVPFEFHPAVTSVEQNPVFAQMCGPNDTVYVVSVELSVEHAEGVVQLCYPSATVAPALERSDRGTLGATASQRAAMARLFNRIDDIPLDVTVQFPPVLLPAEAVAALNVNDVIDFKVRSDATQQLVTGDVLVAEVRCVDPASRWAKAQIVRPHLTGVPS